MVFYDRKEAGIKLGRLLKKKLLPEDKKNLMVLSLIRGGAPVGSEISRMLECRHFPFVVTKIEAPHQPELAIGAVCGGEIYLNHSIINKIGYFEKDVSKSIDNALKKEADYIKKFNIHYDVSSKNIIVVDDGIATGSTICSSCINLRSRKAKKVFLASPVAPKDFNPDDLSMFDIKSPCFDMSFILHKDSTFHAVGQYYKNFPQLSDKDTLTYFTKK